MILAIISAAKIAANIFPTVCGLTRAWEALEAMTFAHRHLREFRREDQV